MALKRVAVDFYYDVGSPYSYICYAVLKRYEKLWTKMNLQLKPVVLGVLLKQSDNASPIENFHKGLYSLNDIERWNRYCNIPIKMPSNFGEIVIEKGSVNALRFVCSVSVLTNDEKTGDISEAFWRRLFTNEPGKDIYEVSSLREAGLDAGLSPELVENALCSMNEPNVKGVLRSNTETASKRGVFGCPTMVVNGKSGQELLFGTDRIEMLSLILGEKYKGPNPEPF